MGRPRAWNDLPGLSQITVLVHIFAVAEGQDEDPCTEVAPVPVGSAFGVSVDGRYTNSADCSWQLRCDVGLTVLVHFASFDTERVLDYVNVHNGEAVDMAELVARHSGDAVPADIWSGPDVSTMRINFRSDEQNVPDGGGFTASYTCSPCAKGGWTLAGGSTLFGNLGNQRSVNYGPHQDNCWLLTCEDGTIPLVKINVFDAQGTEEGDHHIAFYDGETLDAPELAKVQGAGGSLRLGLPAKSSGKSWLAQEAAYWLKLCLGVAQNTLCAHLTSWRDCAAAHPADNTMAECADVFAPPWSDESTLDDLRNRDLPPDVVGTGSAVLVRFKTDTADSPCSSADASVECWDGFASDYTCIDPNVDCSDSPKCGDNAQCVNMNPSYRCHCFDLYSGTTILSGPTTDCTPIDCATDPFCGPNAECVDVDGPTGYDCQCMDGYTGSTVANGPTYCARCDMVEAIDVSALCGGEDCHFTIDVDGCNGATAPREMCSITPDDGYEGGSVACNAAADAYEYVAAHKRSDLPCMWGVTLSGGAESFGIYGGYEDDLDCGWLLTCDPGRLVVVSFTSFATECDKGPDRSLGECDYVYIYDGSTADAVELAKHTGIAAIPSENTFSPKNKPDYVAGSVGTPSVLVRFVSGWWSGYGTQDWGGFDAS